MTVQHDVPIGECDPTMRIARPIDPNWLDEFHHNFEARVDGAATLDMFAAPGVNYVPGTLLYESPQAQAAGVEGALKEHLMRYLDGLAGTRNLGLSGIARPLAATIEGVRIDKRKVSASSWTSGLSFRLYDRRTGVYPCGYVVEGERQKIQPLFGVEPKTLRPNSPSRLPVRIGSLTVLDTTLTPVAIKNALRRSVPEEPRRLRLLAVQPVTFR